MSTRVVDAVRSVLGALAAAAEHHTLVLRLTLVLVLLYGTTSAYTSALIRVVCTAMLAAPALTRRKGLWWILVVALCVGNIIDWYVIDNHKYLIMYWVFACALACGRDGPRGNLDDLAVTARWLVACVFGFATLWKIIGAGYLDGSFLQLAFAIDPRLQPVATAVTGLPAESFTAFSDAVELLGQNGIAGHAVEIPTGHGLALLAVMLSWCGLALEGSVAVAHALPGRRWYALRHDVLGMFVAFTYFLLPVFGFSFVLAILGLAQCTQSDESMRRRYIWLFIIIHATLLPWKALFELLD